MRQVIVIVRQDKSETSNRLKEVIERQTRQVTERPVRQVTYSKLRQGKERQER